MVIGGIDLETVKEILGHATIPMTIHYTRPASENKRYGIEVLAALFDYSNDIERGKLEDSSLRHSQ